VGVGVGVGGKGRGGGGGGAGGRAGGGRVEGGGGIHTYEPHHAAGSIEDIIRKEVLFSAASVCVMSKDVLVVRTVRAK